MGRLLQEGRAPVLRPPSQPLAFALDFYDQFLDWARGQGVRFAGVVQSYYEDTGYGLIQRDEVRAQFNRDAFVPTGLLRNFYVGQKVLFDSVEAPPGNVTAVSVWPLER